MKNGVWKEFESSDVFHDVVARRHVYGGDSGVLRWGFIYWTIYM